MNEIRYDWTLEELMTLHEKPLLELIAQSHATHVRHHTMGEVQVCSLHSIKTGGCPEDCKYCPQSSHYQTTVKAEALMTYEHVLDLAKQAIDRGSTRICLAVAWREVRDNKHFDTILRMIRAISALGVEVCCTLGMIKPSHAQKLKEAGLHSYNHNLDTSEEYYPSIITTRTYQDRLETLDVVRKAGLKVCCGGILGMGESLIDRLKLILTLSQFNPHPNSVPINRLVRCTGTPLYDQPGVPFWDFIRIVAVARLALPKAMVRLSAGRFEMSIQEQALCFLTGANSVHVSEKLLVTPNTPPDQDEEMFQLLGIKKQAAEAYAKCS
jgi:biotin synthase